MTLSYLVAVLPAIYLFAVAPFIFVTDVREHRVPNNLVLPAYLITFVCWFGLALAQGAWLKFWLSIIVTLLFLFFGVILNGRGVVGMGDVKLGAVFAFVMAWSNPLIGIWLLPIFMAVAVALAVGLSMLLPREKIATVVLSPILYLVFGLIFLFIK